MLFSRITPEKVAEVTELVSRERYGGNVVPEWVKHARSQPSLLNQAGTRFRGRIVCYSSDGPGARRSRQGHRSPNACWHVFRDVIEPLVMEHGAKVSTSMAKYTSANWFSAYPETGSINIGSMSQPVTMPELCECSGALRASPSGYVVSDEEHAEIVRRVSRPAVQPPPELFMSQQDILKRIDLVIAEVIKPEDGECASCGEPTLGPSMFWCSQRCQQMFQSKANDN